MPYLNRYAPTRDFMLLCHGIVPGNQGLGALGRKQPARLRRRRVERIQVKRLALRQFPHLGQID